MNDDLIIILIKWYWSFTFYTLSGRIGKVVASLAEVSRSIPAVAETAPIYTMHEALRGYWMPMTVRGATSQFDLPYLTPLSVASCGRLKLGVSHWVRSVDHCMYLIIDHSFCGSKFSTGRLLTIQDFTFFSKYMISMNA